MTTRNLRPQLQAFVCLVVLMIAGAGTVVAQDVTSVSSCPGGSKLPVTLQIDCSHVTSEADKQLCRPFIENQACRVFPAYRKITGIHLENTCKAIKFTIYEDSNWPHPKGEGGLALQCGVDYLAQYSIRSHPKAKSGPYDVHELLHEYQLALGALPDAHVLFSSSMAEAQREIGETDDYDRSLKNMKEESPRLKQELDAGKVTGDRVRRCRDAGGREPLPREQQERLHVLLEARPQHGQRHEEPSGALQSHVLRGLGRQGRSSQIPEEPRLRAVGRLLRRVP
jgi:hypothetical protein